MNIFSAYITYRGVNKRPNKYRKLTREQQLQYLWFRATIEGIKHNWQGINWVLKLLLSYAIELIIAFEIINKKDGIENTLPLFYTVLVFLSKLSYSYLSAFIFYVLTNYLPKQRRKAKLFILFQNQLAYLYDEIKEMYSVMIVYCKLPSNIKPENFINGCVAFREDIENTSALNPVISVREHVYFDTWHKYFEWKSSNIKERISELLTYSDDLKHDTLIYLAYLNSKIDMLAHLKGHTSNPEMNLYILIFDKAIFYISNAYKSSNYVIEYKHRSTYFYQMYGGAGLS